MMHPYARIRKDLRLSQTQLARVADISPQVIMRTEQGMYATPSSKLVSALIGAASDQGQELNMSVLQRLHDDWITRERVRNGVILNKGCQNWLDGLYLKPFYKAFGVASVAGFCKLLCVQLSIVQRWGFSGEMPPLIFDAFREAGVDADVLRRVNRTLC